MSGFALPPQIWTPAVVGQWEGGRALALGRHLHRGLFSPWHRHVLTGARRFPVRGRYSRRLWRFPSSQQTESHPVTPSPKVGHGSTCMYVQEVCSVCFIRFSFHEQRKRSRGMGVGNSSPSLSEDPIPSLLLEQNRRRQSSSRAQQFFNPEKRAPLAVSQDRRWGGQGRSGSRGFQQWGRAPPATGLILGR